MEKLCSACHKMKPFSEFHKNRRRLGLGMRCNNCRKEHYRCIDRPMMLEKKQKIMQEYGNGKCQCCGEMHLEFLTLDHIGGKSTRIKLGHIDRAGKMVYRQLTAQGFPHKDKLRVLCWNCNCSIGIIGYCPHQKLKQEVKV